jgi:cysteine desulfurase/selenocysteine lyase
MGMQKTHCKVDFPFFREHPELVYLDSAATSQKPVVVLQAIDDFYRKGNTNVHRGLYPLAARTSRQYEVVREKVARLLHAEQPQEIVFTSGTTEGINLVAQSYLLPRLQPGAEVLITGMEHHANLIPWQQICQQSGARLRIIPVLESGELDRAAFRQLLNERTALLALTYISNTLGTINPVGEIIAELRAYHSEIPVLVDAAQAIAHYVVDVQQLDADFLVFSGHKAFGPTGVGVLYGKKRHLEAMRPLKFGGDMIENVSFAETTFAAVPRRFEAGTTHVAGIIGLGAAVDYLESLDRPALQEYLQALRALAAEGLSNIPGLRIIGTADKQAAIISFVLEQAHPHDVATFLGSDQIAIRAGHHCTHPLMEHLGLPGTVRASFSIYNTEADVQKLVKAVQEVARFFR